MFLNPTALPCSLAALHLTGHLDVSTDLGDKRVRLLDAIEQHGSISQAAKQVPLSYKAGWDAVGPLNSMADSVRVGAGCKASSVID